MSRLLPRRMEAASTYPALDRLPEAVLLIDPGAQVAFANRTALGLLAQNDGIGLRSDRGGDRLAFADADAQQRFDEIAKAATSPGQARKSEPTFAGLKVPRPSGYLAFVVQVAPLGSKSGGGAQPAKRRAIVFISDPSEAGKLDATMLSSVYSLTPAETRLAEALLTGNPLAEIAAALGIKESTVRTQLLGIFDKTRTSRQAQLIKLLLSVRMPA